MRCRTFFAPILVDAFPISLFLLLCQTAVEFTVPGTRRSRNEQEMAQKKLPLPVLDFPGFKGYLVNMIQVSDTTQQQ